MAEQVRMARGAVAVFGAAKAYGGVAALPPTSFSCPAGSSLAVVGPSGSGKTTLLQIVGGLCAPTSGSAVVAGIDVGALGAGGLAAFRARSVGFVHQFHHLMPGLTAVENVELPMRILRRPRGECRERALELLAQLGLAGKGRRFPSQLSAGERQRVAIARALANGPACVLADEPTGSLDEEAGHDAFSAMQEQAWLAGASMIVATHDEAIAARCSAILRLGRESKGAASGSI